MAKIYDYVTDEENRLSDKLIKDGFIIEDVSSKELLDIIRDEVVNHICSKFDIDEISDKSDFLNNFHNEISLVQLNDIRLSTFRHLNSLKWFRPSIYYLSKRSLDSLIGSELVMQKQVNLSIQLPKDTTSTIGMHADVDSGESPYQLNLWLPLVDCYSTKSFYIMSPEKSLEVKKRLSEYEMTGMSKIFEDYQDHLKWVDVNYGQSIIFDSAVLHGNVVNETKETRFSMNTRFKGLFTPYTDGGKGLGEFYMPITMKAATKIGMNYKESSNF